MQSYWPWSGYNGSGWPAWGGGFLIWLLYGLYNLLKELAAIDVHPIVFIGGVAVAAGIIILLVSTAANEIKEIFYIKKWVMLQ